MSFAGAALFGRGDELTAFLQCGNIINNLENGCQARKVNKFEKKTDRQHAEGVACQWGLRSTTVSVFQLSVDTVYAERGGRNDRQIDIGNEERFGGIGDLEDAGLILFSFGGGFSYRAVD